MHLAIIMDGNGRWAKAQNKPRFFGHQEGAKKIREITEFCAREGVAYLSLYAFSTENWNRPKREVEFLMQLLEEYLQSQVQSYLDANVVFKMIGHRSIFSPSLQQAILALEQKTAKATGMIQHLALNYGSKNEILRAVNTCVAKNLTLQKESDFERLLDTSQAPPVDLLIRTGGEMRLSNFLLWQCAYAELFFTQTLWPSFSSTELGGIIEQFQKRHRRFGNVEI